MTITLAGTMLSFDKFLLKDYGVLLICVIIGTGGMLAFDSRTRKIDLRRIFSSFFMGLFIGFLAKETVEILGWKRFEVLLMVSTSAIAEYVMLWFSKRYMKVFDAVLKKGGLDINKEEDKANDELL